MLRANPKADVPAQKPWPLRDELDCHWRRRSSLSMPEKRSFRGGVPSVGSCRQACTPFPWHLFTLTAALPRRSVTHRPWPCAGPRSRMSRRLRGFPRRFPGQPHADTCSFCRNAALPRYPDLVVPRPHSYCCSNRNPVGGDAPWEEGGQSRRSDGVLGIPLLVYSPPTTVLAVSLLTDCLDLRENPWRRRSPRAPE